jgi:hypothetical protein
MNDQQLVRQLGDTMHRRADALHGTPLDLSDVRGRARTIRRHRQGAVAAAVTAAVAAVVLPLALLTPADRVQDPQPADTPMQVPLDPRSAPQGGAAEVSYEEIDARKLVTPGATYDLPVAYPQIVPYLDAWMALTTAQPGTTGTRVVTLDSEFNEIDVADGATSIAVRPDGDRLAYGWDDSVRWNLVVPATTEAREFTARISDSGPGSDVSAIGWLADDQVVVEATAAGTETHTFLVVAEDGTQTEFDGFDFLDSASFANGLVAGQTSYDDATGSSCSGAMDPTAASPSLLWETCDYQLGQFSPDGKYVVGLGLVSTPGSPSVSVLDAATGKPVVDFDGRAESATVDQVVWEDSSTLLAAVVQDGQHYVVRATLDGELERVAGPIAGTAMDDEFRFPTNPVE